MNMKIIYAVLILCEFTLPLFAQTFEEKLVQLGIVKETQTDWSETKKINISQPNCAYVNITNIGSMPTTKTADLHAYMEVYDCNGNYFKKRVILNAQGNSSLYMPKKNFAADFCEDEWAGDKTTDVTIGDWVTQDAFHFKAYYTDYFRGIATVGYKLYDEIALDRGRLWTRAPEGSILNDKNKSENARCYPDGFPCVVYLNGNFYGVFSWQLKKNRKNMNQTKDLAEHIHLDGVLGDETIWKGSVDWTQFEIRNPKTLYTMNGEKYDGDNPEELIDETSPYYDLETDDKKTKNNKEMTAKVKSYIVAMSNIHDHLVELENVGTSKAEMRAAIEASYDVVGLVDYICFHFVVLNHDGFTKNWQWFTYDGKKWFVAPYDLDGIFGAMHTGSVILPAYWYMSGNPLFPANPKTSPAYWVCRYYNDEIKARFQELRSKNILSADNIKSIIKNWYYRLGENQYVSEYEKWPESPCVGNIVLNHNWTTTDDWPGGWPSFYTIADYNPDMTYEAGDKCKLDNRLWVATGTTCGVKPYQGSLGHHDSLQRIEEWIDARMNYLDIGYGIDESFKEESSYTLIISNAEWTTLCVPFAYSVPDGVIVYAVNGIDPETNELVLEQVDVPEANKPYLLNGPAGIYHLTGKVENTDPESEDYLVNRFMQGTYETKMVPVGAYVLQNQNGKVQFYKVTIDNLPISPNRAYVQIPIEMSAPVRVWFDDEVVTNISPSHVDETPEFYNLCGERISTMNEGVNIVKYGTGDTKKIIKQ